MTILVQNTYKECLGLFQMFRICNKKRTKEPTLVQVVDIRQNVVTTDEMTMAQYKIIHSNDTMVTENFQQIWLFRRKELIVYHV